MRRGSKARADGVLARHGPDDKTSRIKEIRVMQNVETVLDVLGDCAEIANFAP
jgi:hypothetical protein